ncbi:hypothetical protein HYH03_016286, partial [Edaphochlamys debaryana]
MAAVPSAQQPPPPDVSAADSSSTGAVPPQAEAQAPRAPPPRRPVHPAALAALSRRSPSSGPSRCGCGCGGWGACWGRHGGERGGEVAPAEQNGGAEGGDSGGSGSSEEESRGSAGAGSGSRGGGALSAREPAGRAQPGPHGPAQAHGQAQAQAQAKWLVDLDVEAAERRRHAAGSRWRRALAALAAELPLPPLPSALTHSSSSSSSSHPSSSLFASWWRRQSPGPDHPPHPHHRPRPPPPPPSGNTVVTSRYTALTFAPVFLFELFARPAYLYFLLQAALSWWSVVSPFSGIGSTAALLFVVAVSGVKSGVEDSGVEDVRRHLEDRATNAAPTRRLLPDGGTKAMAWEDVRVGDILEVRDGELIPADLLLLATGGGGGGGGEGGVAYVRTTQLDGETNLKPRHAARLPGWEAEEGEGEGEGEGALVSRLRGQLEAPPPGRSLHSFSGALHLAPPPPGGPWAQPLGAGAAASHALTPPAQPLPAAEGGRGQGQSGAEAAAAHGGPPDGSAQGPGEAKAAAGAGPGPGPGPGPDPGPGPGPGSTVAISMDHMLLRGCQLMNTGYALGLAVYCGPQSRIQMNASPPPNKIGSYDRFLNRQIAVLLLIQLVLSVGSAVWSWAWRRSVGLARPHLGLADPAAGNWGPAGAYIPLLSVTFWILYSYLVPISLFVSMELVKAVQAFVFVGADPALSEEAGADPEPPPAAGERAGAGAGAGAEGGGGGGGGGARGGADRRSAGRGSGGGAWSRLARARPHRRPHSHTHAPPHKGGGAGGTREAGGAGEAPPPAASDAPLHGFSRSSAAPEDLGRVAVVFADKTGTLTRNDMRLRTCSLGEGRFGSPSVRLEEAPRLRFPATLGAFDPRLAEAASALRASGGWEAAGPSPDEVALLQGARRLGWALVGRDREGLTLRVQAPPHPAATAPATAAPAAPTAPASAASPPAGHPASAADGEGWGRGKGGGKGGEATEATAGADGQGDAEGGAEGDPEGVAPGSSPVLAVRWRLLAVLEFSSARKRMSVVARAPDGSLLLLCKGADSALLPRLVAPADPAGGEGAEGGGGAERQAAEASLAAFAEQGLRTLVVAAKPLAPAAFADWDRRYQAAAADVGGGGGGRGGGTRGAALDALAEELESGLGLVGVVGIEDRLQAGVPEAVAGLRAAGVRLWMITGDKLETAVNIARSAGLVTAPRDDQLLVLRGAEGGEAGEEGWG